MLVSKDVEGNLIIKVSDFGLATQLGTTLKLKIQDKQPTTIFEKLFTVVILSNCRDFQVEFKLNNLGEGNIYNANATKKYPIRWVAPGISVC